MAYCIYAVRKDTRMIHNILEAITAIAFMLTLFGVMIAILVIFA